MKTNQHMLFCSSRQWAGIAVRIVVLALCGALGFATFGQAPPKKAAPAKASPKAGEQPKFKAIWEPANVSEDLDLRSVYFVSPDEGWVAGGKTTMEGGVIYHTKDGGQSWELQVGDPASSDRGFTDLQFLDATHGFAVQGSSGNTHKLFTTSDGQTWVPSGTVPEHRYASFFTSPTTGFVADPNKQVIRTTDAGKKWEPVYQCRIKAEIGGLMREADCYIYGIHFPTPAVGYAIGGPLPEDAGNVLAKTEDGGNTWTNWVVLPGESAHESSLRFIDADNGVFRAKDGKMFRTADGGKTWTGVSGQGELKSELSFAGPNAGWCIYYRKMTYTGNGGKSWLSRDIAFPVMVEDSILVAPDRGYAVGEHGMVYRYRIVPIDYTSKGMLAAPALATR
jgi:photosystem II stability/assembly factor-like uncharacterized protein